MDDYDDELTVSAEVAAGAAGYVEDQEARRGDWPSLRLAGQPDFPWPDPDNAMLKYLMESACARLDRGEPPDVVALHLAVHA
jgi:hypothetical protein